jgi:hypothetical protein
MENYLDKLATSGFVNLIGGCCGNTPDHVATISRVTERHATRAVPLPYELLLKSLTKHRKRYVQFFRSPGPTHPVADR